MRLRTSRFGLLAAGGCLVLAAALAVPIEQAVTARQPGREVTVRQLAAGKMLVASRRLADPNFTETVLLLIEYRTDGAAGLVLTRQSELPLARALPDLAPVAPLAMRPFVGGPVAHETVLALSRTACPGCRMVTRGVHLVNDGDMLRQRLASGDDDRTLRVYTGYAGWSAGQLAAEVREDAWRVVPGDAAAVFDGEPETLWRRMLARAESVLADRGTGGEPSGADVVDGLR
ncbi:YqgE/AlgH family protein [Luteitalea sp. TBR-22]|uniref:YqgE/AlgH family protein n=1 Tax=Luteitalea sp. TBR-22 TaxID=2802971 RepID=UPI001EF64390|nr:YqgE/AlgH family protein [Luteitalea sp. TBR-22]